MCRVASCQEKTKFSPGQGNVKEFLKNVRKFGHLTKVREMSGNFVMTIKIVLKMISLLLIAYFFKS